MRRSGDVGPGLGDHFGGHIHADDKAGGSDFFRRDQQVQTGPRTQVQDGLASLHPTKGQRIAAAHGRPGYLLARSCRFFR
ncbi:hypothetical protein ES703_49206 [subsurface metagenome]